MDDRLELILKSRLDNKDIEQQLQGIVKDYKVLEDGTKRLVIESHKLSEGIGKYHTLVFKVKKGTDELVLSRVKEHENLKLSTDQIVKQEIAQRKLLLQIREKIQLDKAYIERGGLAQQYEDLEDVIAKLNPETLEFNNLLKLQQINFDELNSKVKVTKQEVRDSSKYFSLFGEQIIDAGKFCQLYREPVNAGCMIHV